jgi:bile acid:Na+ symporter, BASS family
MHMLQILLPLLIQLARAFVAISIIVPVVAVLVVRTLPISLPSKVGVILMALAPVPPFVPGRNLKLGGHKSYVYGLYVAFALLAVIIVPATVAVLNHLYGASADVPMGKLVGTVVFSVLLPLVIGMLLHARWPAATSTAALWVGRLAILLALSIVVPLVVKAWPAMVSMTGDGTILAILLIVVAGAAAGHMLGGPDLADRVVLANSAATRHPGIALMIATTSGLDKRVIAIILLFVLVALVTMTIYKQVVQRIARPKPTAAATVAR